MIPISLLYSFSGMTTSFMNGVGVPSVVSNIHQCMHWTYPLTVLNVFLCSDIDHNDHYYHDHMPRLSTQLSQEWARRKVVVKHSIKSNHVCHLWFCLARMQSRPEPHWTVMGPAGESCSNQSHHRHPLQDLRQIVVDECNVIPQQRVLRRLVVLPATNVVNVWNEVLCGEIYRVFIINSLITTGDRYMYIEVSLINVILALFSDDSHSITNPIIQCTQILVIMLAWMKNKITRLP